MLSRVSSQSLVAVLLTGHKVVPLDMHEEMRLRTERRERAAIERNYANVRRQQTGRGPGNIHGESHVSGTAGLWGERGQPWTASVLSRLRPARLLLGLRRWGNAGDRFLQTLQGPSGNVSRCFARPIHPSRAVPTSPEVIPLLAAFSSQPLISGRPWAPGHPKARTWDRL
jgi:hypothetical protein